ncbi:MAG: hypothetical protein V3V81_07445 [Candidatus Bathyarchaeia archaeon]
MTDTIHIVAVEIDGVITNDKEEMRRAIQKNKMPKLIRREIFEFMEDLDMWCEHEFSKLPPMYRLTPEQWKTAQELGIAK